MHEAAETAHSDVGGERAHIALLAKSTEPVYAATNVGCRACAASRTLVAALEHIVATCICFTAENVTFHAIAQIAQAVFADEVAN